jgi:hypothetical protein
MARILALLPRFVLGAPVVFALALYIVFLHYEAKYLARKKNIRDHFWLRKLF